jgi:hypothetical protein
MKKEIKIGVCAFLSVATTAICAADKEVKNTDVSNTSAPEVPVVKAPFVNDICLPSKMWMLQGEQNDIFVQPFLKRWRPYNDFVRFSLPRKVGKPARALSHVATIKDAPDGTMLTVNLVNGDEFETVKSCKTKLMMATPRVGSKPVTVQIIGDSFTHGKFYEYALLDSGLVPNIKMVGLLKARDGQYNEGRGGWALSTYFNVPKRDDRSYHGFMQPEEGRYWGTRGFWRMAWRCTRKTQPKGFEPTYSCARFDDYVKNFDEKTGVLLNPQTGDMQYDPETKTMYRFDSKSWVKTDASKIKWGFDYGKYLDMWKIEPPQFVFVLLGLNDFRGSLTADFTQWGKNITAMKESYLKACPNGKFVICIPCSSCGSLDNVAGDFTVKQNASMWRFRKWLIDNFDNREKEGFYLLDAGVATDNENGYRFLSEKDSSYTTPYFKGEGTLKVQTGNPHPYPNYPTMGYPFAAFIQYYREK